MPIQCHIPPDYPDGAASKRRLDDLARELDDRVLLRFGGDGFDPELGWGVVISAPGAVSTCRVPFGDPPEVVAEKVRAAVVRHLGRA